MAFKAFVMKILGLIKVSRLFARCVCGGGGVGWDEVGWGGGGGWMGDGAVF